MTGKDLIIYILQNDLENEIVIKDGIFVWRPLLNSVLVCRQLKHGTFAECLAVQKSVIIYISYEILMTHGRMRQND